MKLFMKVIICVTVVYTLISSVVFESTCRDIENDVFRIHILANSDSESDQNLKLSVRDDILKKSSFLFDNVKTKQDAIIIAHNNLPYIKNIACNTVRENGFDYDVDLRIENKFFDTRYYDDFTMPAGMYDCLVIKIGQAKGKNWWCVMYPTLCVGAATDSSMKDSLSDNEYDVVTSDEYEFRFKILEYFKKLYLYFG